MCEVSELSQFFGELKVAQVEKVPSKITQYDSTNDLALCEDGSVWWYDSRSKKWTRIELFEVFKMS